MNKLPKSETRVFSINDFISWHERGELCLGYAAALYKATPIDYSPDSPFAIASEIMRPRPKSFSHDYFLSGNEQSYFIDTILQGFPVPTIYLSLDTNVEERKTVRNIFLGVKCLNAIISFYNNEFGLFDNNSPDKIGKKYSDLNEETQHAFLSKDLAVVYLHTNQLNEIQDIFARLDYFQKPMFPK